MWGQGSLLGPGARPGGHPARLPSLPSGPTGKGWFPARGPGAQGLRTRDPGPGKRPPGLAGFGFLGETHCTPSSRLPSPPPPPPLAAAQAVGPEPGRASGQLRQAKQHGARGSLSSSRLGPEASPSASSSSEPTCCALAAGGQGGQPAGRLLSPSRGGASSGSQPLATLHHDFLPGSGPPPFPPHSRFVCEGQLGAEEGGLACPVYK